MYVGDQSLNEVTGEVRIDHKKESLGTLSSNWEEQIVNQACTGQTRCGITPNIPILLKLGVVNVDFPE